MITFCINTAKNEYDYINLLLGALSNAVGPEHEVLVFVDSDNQGTTEVLQEWKSEFRDLNIIKNNGNPVGYATNINYMFTKAKHEIVSYLQSDMVPCLAYDTALLSQLTDKMILCSTRVEPPIHAPQDNPITFVRDFGLTPADFSYSDFLAFAHTVRNPHKLSNYFFAPFTCYKKVWNDIGGHDVSFLKSREDSDVAVRLALNGTQLVQSWDALVYHFTCTSSRQWAIPENRTKNINYENDQKELHRFVGKWGKFVHPMVASDVQGMDKSKIIVKNPPIDESQFTFL